MSNPIGAQINTLENQFCCLSSSFLEELTEKEMNAKDVKKHILSLPYRLKRELFYPISEHTLHITKKSDMSQLFFYLDATIWNFIDYTLLEHLVSIFGSDALQSEMETYVTNLSTFEKQTTVSQLIQCWPGRKEVPPNYSELTAKIDLKPDECTIEQLNSLRTGLRERFLPPLSEYALLHFNLNEGSILVKWLIPNDRVPHFTNAICMPRSAVLLQALKISTLRIQGILVYPISINEAVLSGNNMIGIKLGHASTDIWGVASFQVADLSS